MTLTNPELPRRIPLPADPLAYDVAELVIGDPFKYAPPTISYKDRQALGASLEVVADASMLLSQAMKGKDPFKIMEAKVLLQSAMTVLTPEQQKLATDMLDDFTKDNLELVIMSFCSDIIDAADGGMGVAKNATLDLLGPLVAKNPGLVPEYKALLTDLENASESSLARKDAVKHFLLALAAKRIINSTANN